MNVLQVNTVYQNGSTGRITAEIAEYAAIQANARSFVAFGIGEPTQQSNLSAYRIGNSLERKIHGVIRKLFDAEGYGSHLATRQLIKFCEDSEVDIVHMHNLHGCYLNLKRWFRYLQQADISVIWTLHDCWPMTGHCAHFEYIGCKKWQTLCDHCPQKDSYPACIGISGSKRNYRFKKKLFSRLQNLTIVTPCRWLQGIVKKSFLENAPIRVIYNGVDTQRFIPITSDIKAQYGIEDKRLLLSVASNWTDRKGFHILQKLSEALDETYQIAIIGLSQEQIQALPADILGVERIDSTHTLCSWYSAADCFVNPTLEDTMPLVNLEALACGTPVIVFNTGGCSEVVTDACGMVVDKDDVQGLLVAVKRICESGTDYTHVCIKQAKHYDLQHTLQSYYELYQEVSQ